MGRSNVKTSGEPVASFPEAFFRSEFLKLGQLGETAPIGRAVLDSDLKYVLVNESLAVIDGRPVDQHSGKNIHEVDPHTGSALEPLFNRVIEKEVPLVNVEIKVPSPGVTESSEDRYLLLSCYPLIPDSAAAAIGVGVTFRDVTEQKLKEMAQDERLKFEALLSTLSAEFINMTVSEVDTKVVQSLVKVTDFFGVDRSTVYLTTPEGRLARTYSYSLPEIKPHQQPPPIIDEIVPVWVELARDGRMHMINDIDEQPDNQWREKKYCQDLGGIRSLLFIPLTLGGRVMGTMSICSYNRKKIWKETLVHRIRLLGEIFANAIERKHVDQKMQTAFAEIQQLKDRLVAENILLRDQIETELKHEGIIGESEAINRVLLQARQVAATDATVLVLGETGTGKELIARAIHDRSERRDRPMIKLNCAALPATLIEAELFGREKGAYTGAGARQIGRFEAAHRSTIFLDEVGELPLELQAKLLRVLQEGQFERLGSIEPVKVDVRVIAATNRNLALAVKNGTFREDLYYRLNVFPISVPPLRERTSDIPLLVRSLVKEFGKSFGKTIENIQKKNMDALERYSWPGNVRELRNAVERAMILNDGPTLLVEVPNASAEKAPTTYSLQQVERSHIIAVLEKTGWRIRGKNCAAELLELNPSTLESKMRKLGIKRKEARKTDRSIGET